MTVMTLSAAIRLGAMALPEVHGPVFEYDGDGVICGACAVGAALYAVGLTGAVGDHDKYDAAFPLFDRHVTCPVSGCRNDGWQVIINLFESYGWSREQIADEVERWEQQQDAQALVPVAQGVA